ncbi:hypothetical protein RJ639_026829 [Escallonia herrerae]|uniref:Pentatricopeptide repeat-containing protein n=1 Tax=Escallonia herrerae TaxID=1293975 RepID=A0AA88X6X3_9ASTE|nr:hypothetical protein RJ639_026829 [Escallonia herrerae]
MLASKLTTLLHNPVTVKQAKQIHALILINGLNDLEQLLVHQILRYSRSYCWSTTQYLQLILHHMQNPDVFSGACTIRFLCRYGQFREAFAQYVQMQRSALFPSTFAVSSALKACAKTVDWVGGISIHAQVHKYGFWKNVYVQTALVDFYSKVGNMATAHRLFDEMVGKNVVSWNSVLSGYLKSGDLEMAQSVFDATPNKDVISWNSIVASPMTGISAPLILQISDLPLEIGGPRAKRAGLAEDLVPLLCIRLKRKELDDMSIFHIDMLLETHKLSYKVEKEEDQDFKWFKAEPDVIHISQSIYQLVGIIDDLMEDAHVVNLISLEREVAPLNSLNGEVGLRQEERPKKRAKHGAEGFRSKLCSRWWDNDQQWMFLRSQPEKAYESVLSTRLPILDDGVLRGRHGFAVDFSSTKVIFASDTGNKLVISKLVQNDRLDDIRSGIIKEVTLQKQLGFSAYLINCNYTC